MKLSDCPNWKVGVELLGVGIVGYIMFPTLVGRFAPFLIFLICPLSMLFLMKAMHGSTPEQPKIITTSLPQKKPNMPKYSAPYG